MLLTPSSVIGGKSEVFEGVSLRCFTVKGDENTHVFFLNILNQHTVLPYRFPTPDHEVAAQAYSGHLSSYVL